MSVSLPENKFGIQFVEGDFEPPVVRESNKDLWAYVTHALPMSPGTWAQVKHYPNAAACAAKCTQINKGDVKALAPTDKGKFEATYKRDVVAEGEKGGAQLLVRWVGVAVTDGSAQVADSDDEG